MLNVSHKCEHKGQILVTLSITTGFAVIPVGVCGVHNATIYYMNVHVALFPDPPIPSFSMHSIENDWGSSLGMRHSSSKKKIGTSNH